MNAHHSHGRAVAWAGFVFGSVMSVAANVLHAWLPADEMPEGWHPEIAQQVGAAVWPVALLISVEVLSRVNWKSGFGWKLVRFGGAGVVAAASAVISYGHLHDVLVEWDYTWIGAVAGPLVLDGLMVVSGFALLSMSKTDTPRTKEEPVKETIEPSTQIPVDIINSGNGMVPTVNGASVYDVVLPRDGGAEPVDDLLNEVREWAEHRDSTSSNDIQKHFKVGRTRANKLRDGLSQ